MLETLLTLIGCFPQNHARYPQLSALVTRREASTSWPRPWESEKGLAGVAPVLDAPPLSGIKLGLEFAHGYNSSGQARCVRPLPFEPNLLRDGIEGMRGSMVIRLRPCMT